MKKNILFTILISLLYFVNQAQEIKHPKDAYLSFEEIKTKDPALLIHLNLEKRSPTYIKMVGGNDYKVTSTDKAIKPKKIKKEF